MGAIFRLAPNDSGWRDLRDMPVPAVLRMSAATRNWAVAPSLPVANTDTGCSGNPFREGANHSGGAVGDIQPGVDVLQVGAYRSLRQPQLAGDLEIAAPACDQVQQVPLASGELGDGAPLAFSIVVGLLEMGPQQGEKRPVAL